MSFEEKNAWVMLAISIGGYAIYLIVALNQGAGRSLTEIAYVPILLWSIGGAVLAGILCNIGIVILSPRDADKRDQRDREIHRFGEYVGQSFVVIGGIAALGMALAEIDHFWIANVIYLCFVLSGVLGSIAKLFAYRLGFHPW